MNIFREIILDTAVEPDPIDWPVVFDLLLIVAWFAATAWVLMS